MRLSGREIKEFSDLAELLGRCDTIRLGLQGEEYPYVVPHSFGYEVEKGRLVLYVHGAKEGKKHDLIAKNDKVCVEADIFHRYAQVPNGITTVYESLIGYGRAQKVSGDEAVKGLDLLLAHCGYAGFSCDKRVRDATTVYQIVLERVTGKRRAV